MPPEPLDVVRLAAAVRAAQPRLGSVRLVVIDGPAGSGKTSAAAAVVAGLPNATVVHMDDLYEGWTGLHPGLWRRLTEQVLAPLAVGEPARYRVYDWHRARFDRWVDLGIAEVLVLEGVGAAAQPVEPYASLRVWVEAPAELRLRRGVERDGEQLRDEWLRWTEREVAHFERDGTRERADVLVDGTAPPVG